MPEAEHGNDLVLVVALLGAGIVAVTLFKRLGLGSVLGYLAAGLVIGPFGLGWVAHPESILRVAELGVVLFLFIVGLEMRPAKLWSLRREIFGLGAVQVALCGAILTGIGLLLDLSPAVAFVAAMGFVLSSTAIVMQILEERGLRTTEQGQRIVSILLLEDLAIVPLLAIVAFIAPAGDPNAAFRWIEVATALGAVAGLVAAGIWLLNPLFMLLASSHAREVMTGAALLVVLGAALLMQLSGLSMAMGAFLAGVLLSESLPSSGARSRSSSEPSWPRRPPRPTRSRACAPTIAKLGIARFSCPKAASSRSCCTRQPRPSAFSTRAPMRL
jgi:glutathione-regulated potassium-efflux system protein KefB